LYQDFALTYLASWIKEIPTTYRSTLAILNGIRSSFRMKLTEEVFLVQEPVRILFLFMLIIWKSD